MTLETVGKKGQIKLKLWSLLAAPAPKPPRSQDSSAFGAGSDLSAQLLGRMGVPRP